MFSTGICKFELIFKEDQYGINVQTKVHFHIELRVVRKYGKILLVFYV